MRKKKPKKEAKNRGEVTGMCSISPDSMAARSQGSQAVRVEMSLPVCWPFSQPISSGTDKPPISLNPRSLRIMPT